MKKLVLGGAFVAATLIGGCGGSGGPEVATPEEQVTLPQAPTTTTAPTPDPTAQARAYFDALATNDPISMRAAIDGSTPASPARAYAEEQTITNGPRTLQPDEVRADATGITVCSANGQRHCTRYDQIEADPTTGLVTTFDVEGRPLATLIRSAGAPVTEAGITVQATHAYQATGGHLWIALDVTNGTPHPFQPYVYSTSYVGPDGRQVAPSGADAATSIVASGATSTIIAVFPAADFGGQLHLSGLVDDGTYRTAPDFVVPIG